MITAKICWRDGVFDRKKSFHNSSFWLSNLLGAAILRCSDCLLFWQRTIEQPFHVITIQDGDTREILKLQWAIWKLFVTNDFFSDGFCCKHCPLVKFSCRSGSLTQLYFQFLCKNVNSKRLSFLCQKYCKGKRCANSASFSRQKT